MHETELGILDGLMIGGAALALALKVRLALRVKELAVTEATV